MRSPADIAECAVKRIAAWAGEAGLPEALQRILTVEIQIAVNRYGIEVSDGILNEQRRQMDDLAKIVQAQRETLDSAERELDSTLGTVLAVTRVATAEA